jgi:hypothetical protein
MLRFEWVDENGDVRDVLECGAINYDMNRGTMLMEWLDTVLHAIEAKDGKLTITKK